MAQLKPINIEGFSGLRWVSPQSFAFAESWGTIPLSLAEVYPLASVMPVGFSRKGQSYHPVAICGQQPDRNLFVGPKGQWAGRLIPQALRVHPFRLVATGDGNFSLCADVESPCVVEPPVGQPFFEDGQIAPPLTKVLDALRQREADIRGPLAKACDAIADEDLFEPWPLEFQHENGATVRHDSLYRVKTAALNSLDGPALERLHKALALPLVYAHRLSTYHVHLLDRLAKAHGLGRKDVDLDDLFGEDDDDLSFNF